MPDDKKWCKKRSQMYITYNSAMNDIYLVIMQAVATLFTKNYTVSISQKQMSGSGSCHIGRNAEIVLMINNLIRNQTSLFFKKNMEINIRRKSQKIFKLLPLKCGSGIGDRCDKGLFYFVVNLLVLVHYFWQCAFRK